MRKVAFSISLVLALFTATVALAAQNNTQKDCNPSLEWKNHGAYVACVAKQHPGGLVLSSSPVRCGQKE